MKKVTSYQNPIVQHLIKLVRDPSYRKQHHSLIIEGKKIILEALQKHSLKQLYVAENNSLIEGFQNIEISNDLAQKISSLKTSDGYIAEIEMPLNANLSSTKQLLVLDQLQDPGNMGTLIRSALAFGFDGIFIVKPSVDVYSPKVIRASMGANLSVPIQIGTYEELEITLSAQPFLRLVADASGATINQSKIEIPVALILGNEAHGSMLKNNPNYKKVAIPIEHIDSLNVAVAGSLLMHQLKEHLCK